MPIPDITHLQFLVLGLLLDGQQSGRYIREKLADAGQRKTRPAFYQMMARLEDDKLIRGWYDQKVIDGQIIKERRYEISRAGMKAFDSVREFYIRHAGLRLAGGYANA